MIDTNSKMRLVRISTQQVEATSRSSFSARGEGRRADASGGRHYAAEFSITLFTSVFR